MARLNLETPVGNLLLPSFALNSHEQSLAFYSHESS